MCRFPLLFLPLTFFQEGFTPSSLKGIKLHKSDVSWSDVGGKGFFILVYLIIVP